jgi:hypothetical protein
MYKIEQKLGIEDDPPSPLEELRDPFGLYDEAMATTRAAEAGPSSDPHDKRKAPCAQATAVTNEDDDDDSSDGDDGDEDYDMQMI